MRAAWTGVSKTADPIPPLPVTTSPATSPGDGELTATERVPGGSASPAVASAAPAPAERVEAVRADGGGDTDLHPAYDGVVVADDGRELSLRRDGRWYAVPLGDGSWAEATWHRDTEDGTWSLPVAASGGWRDEHRFCAEVLVVETAHRFTVEVRRDDAGRAEADLRWSDVPLNGSDPWDSAARRGPLGA